MGNIEVLRIGHVIEKYSVPKKILIAFHNGSNCNYHFIIKQFAKELNCLGENTEKCIAVLQSLQFQQKEKVTRINENKEVAENISYILQFIDSARFMASLISNFVNNLSVGIYEIKCKYGHDDKKWET